MRNTAPVKISKAFKRTRWQYFLWQELQKAIDASPEVPPCTNYPDLFFPEGAAGFGDVRAAQKLCKKCPIQLQCAIYGVQAEEEHGVWGGLSAHDRRKLKIKHGSPRKSAEALTIRYRHNGRDGVQANKR